MENVQFEFEPELREAIEFILAKANVKTIGRIFGVLFLYQTDIQKMYLHKKELDIFWRNINLYVNELQKRENPNIENSKLKYIKKFSSRLICGVIENLEKIDAKISRYLRNWKVSRLDIIDRNILRVACFEIMFCNDIPNVVSINEAVNIAKDFGTDKSGQFINGVLNSIKNELEQGVDDEA